MTPVLLILRCVWFVGLTQILWANCLITWSSPIDSKTNSYLIPKRKTTTRPTTRILGFMFFFHSESKSLLLRSLIQLWSFEMINPGEELLCESSIATFSFSYNLRNVWRYWFIAFIILLTSIIPFKHDLLLNAVYSFSSRCIYTYKKVNLLPLNIISQICEDNK